VSLGLLSGCGGSTDAPSAPPVESIPGTASAPQGTGATPKADAPSPGSRLKIGLMPKKKGIPYFTACQQGAEEAAKELGDVEVVYDGPIEDKSEEQSSMVDTWALRKFDAITIACNDPDQITTSLARARDAGITVVTYDADAAASSKRQLFVNQADVTAIAETLVDEMAKHAGPDAEVAVISSTSTAPNQTAWLKAMDAYRARKFPAMKVVVTEYPGEVQNTALEKTQSVLKAYPKVKGIWGMSSVAFPGAAQAVEKAGLTGKVAVVGLSTPKTMKEFVDRGLVKSVVLWSPVDLGYLTVFVARAVARGELKEGATSFEAGRLGKKEIRGHEVLLGKPMVFTAENIGKYDF
jgi:rhamnose transport system substrate-binding protein